MWLILLHYWAVVLFCASSFSSARAEKVHFVHWNSTNPMFYNSISPVIEVTTSADHWNYEQANIICPFYDKSVPKSLTEQYVVYNVTREEFFKCSIGEQQQQKIVALCNTPYRPNFFTLTFRSFSPTPGAFEFHPGQEYYFISTRPGSDQCSHPPIRLIFRIKNRLSTEEQDDIADNSVTHNKEHEVFIGSPREMPIMYDSGAQTQKLSIILLLTVPYYICLH